MQRRALILRISATILMLTALALAGTPGSFRGYLVDIAATTPGWVYVQSRNDMLRRVRVTGASVTYSPEIPLRLRRADPRASLVAGAEVRVMAEEDGKGNWHAREIEILQLAVTERAHK